MELKSSRLRTRVGAALFGLLVGVLATPHAQDDVRRGATTGITGLSGCGASTTVVLGNATCSANVPAATIVGSGGQTLDLSTANTTDLRNSTTAQLFNVYNTSSSNNTNYERVGFAWSANVAYLNSEAAGTGTARELRIATNGSGRWAIGATTGHFTAVTDNTYDIGAAADKRPRNGYFGTSINLNTSLTFSATVPTFTSGFGGATGRTITGSAAVFSIVVGSSSTDNNGVLGLPTATNGWVCRAENQTSPGATDIKQSASTTSSVTLTQYNTTLGSASNFAASDIVKGTCIAY